MSVFPHSRLFLGPSKSVLISGPHIQVLDTHTGNLLHSTATLDGLETAKLLKSGPVRCSTVDRGFTYVVTSGEDKKLKVWEVDGLKLLSERELPKKPTEIRVTQDGQTIVVSDKFGDIFSYPLHLDPSLERTESEGNTGTTKRGTLASHENPSNGTLILGHTSLLTSFVLTSDEQFVISADRDEHVRVSWFPQGYVIERYCLGHEKFVSAIHVPSFAPSQLVTGGGDPVLKLWDWMSEPFIVVKAPISRYGRSDDDDGDDGEQEKVEKIGRRGRKGRGKKAKGKGKNEGVGEEAMQEQEQGEAGQSMVSAEGEGTEDVVMGDVESEAQVESERVTQVQAEAQEAEATTVEGALGEAAEKDKLVFALRRIDSADVHGQGQFLVFSAVGATALFFCVFPSSPQTKPPVVQSLDLKKPVLDFTVGAGGHIWVLVDDERPSTSERPTGESDERAVRLVSWLDGKLVEVHGAESKTFSLLTSLNTTCVLPATASDLKTLDLYSALSSLPKNVDPEHDPMRRENQNQNLDAFEIESVASSRAGTPIPGGSKKGKAKSGGPTQRELARMKNKKAVLAKMQEQEQAKMKVGDGAGAELGGVTDEERENKKARAADSEGSVQAL
ncbi:hypothetical protein EW026_g4740 [Hermanssonia centrifuga]|uniref:Uncharacterized protein n=1 Tax=Hermanssonia centrifuga TaxID=98765 RepID=A0A4S4KGI5_9APHY|nr:hypothetical protein EW026_g4740 [Hermanssonia centrifuga]